MKNKNSWWLGVLALLCGAAIFWRAPRVGAQEAATASAPATVPAKFNVVGFYTGTHDMAHINFVHEANEWFPKMATANGFAYTATKDWKNLNREYLAKFQVVMFLDDSPHAPDQRAAFQEYM